MTSAPDDGDRVTTPPIVAVLGASGFIGSHVARRLVARGAQVRSVVAPRLVTSARALDEIEADARAPRWAAETPPARATARRRCRGGRGRSCGRNGRRGRPLRRRRAASGPGVGGGSGNGPGGACQFCRGPRATPRARREHRDRTVQRLFTRKGAGRAGSAAGPLESGLFPPHIRTRGRPWRHPDSRARRLLAVCIRGRPWRRTDASGAGRERRRCHRVRDPDTPGGPVGGAASTRRNVGGSARAGAGEPRAAPHPRSCGAQHRVSGSDRGTAIQ